MSKEKQKDQLYSIGDLVVHAYYGVGEIVDIEEKKLFGEIADYYVVETEESTYWLPVKNDDTDRVRPIASSEDILEVIRTLEETPSEMQDHHKARKKRITDAKTDGDILSTAAAVRDLSYRQAVDRLNTTEQKALERLKKRLVTEWAASKDQAPQKVRAKINKIFQRHRQEEE